MTEEECKRVRAVDAPGHRSGVRALALSSDDAVVLSAAAGAVKLWNPTSGACLRTIETGQVGCQLPSSGDVCQGSSDRARDAEVSVAGRPRG